MYTRTAQLYKNENHYNSVFKRLEQYVNCDIVNTTKYKSITVYQ